MPAQQDINQLKGVIRRRKKTFIMAFLLIFLLVGSIAFILPAIYRSEATIVIEEQHSRRLFEVNHYKLC